MKLRGLISNFGGALKLVRNNYKGDWNSVVTYCRKEKWNAYPLGDAEAVKSPQDFMPLKLNGSTISIHRGATFTPYANPKKCPANCKYCSECLKKTGMIQNANPKYFIGDHNRYFQKLDGLLNLLQKQNITMGLSLSGLEATSDVEWFTKFFDLYVKYKGSLFNSGVLYSNGANILTVLDQCSFFDRIELHRDHFIEEKNQKLMRIDKRFGFQKNDAFINIVDQLRKKTQVAAVSIVSKERIHTAEQSAAYVEWAKKLGFHGVVHRNLCHVESMADYEENETKVWIRNNRVNLSDLCYKPEMISEITIGYYYYAERSFPFPDAPEFSVSMEESNYEKLEQITNKKKDVAHKLIFHSNGNLTKGWNPTEDVLLQLH